MNRGFDPLRKCLKRHGDASSITERHVVAADILRGIAAGALIGFTALRDFATPVANVQYRPIPDPILTTRRQARCWRRFAQVMAIFTEREAQLLTFVVLLNNAIATWVDAQQVAGFASRPSIEMGKLVAILDQLEAYFSTELDREPG